MSGLDLIKNLGDILPKKKYTFHIVLPKAVQKTVTSCSCTSLNFTKNPRIVEGSYEFRNEFPFQVEEDSIPRLQTVKITYTDGTEGILKVTARLWNPDLKTNNDVED